MAIAIVEPFYTGSHQKWCDQLKSKLFTDAQVFSLPGRFWKWRMHGGAITLANQVNQSNKQFEKIIVSSMVNLPLFKSLLKSDYSSVPIAIYFHENQFAYPWSPNDEDVKLNRDENYKFINYTSALIADQVFFNSLYNKNSFLIGVNDFLDQFPDFNNKETFKVIQKKCKVLPLGLDLKTFDSYTINREPNLILWNHRWEYDKNPEAFYRLLVRLKENKYDFKLVVLGEHTSKYPEVFDIIKQEFKNELIHFGYVETFQEYASWLYRSTLLPVTSNQDFFGISVVEAMHCGVIPILPNRLAFPEHIYESKNLFLYESEEELFHRVRDLLSNKSFYEETLKKSILNKMFIQKYDWSNIHEEYLNAFK